MKYLIRMLIVLIMGVILILSGCKKTTETVETPDYEGQILTLQAEKEQLIDDKEAVEASLEQMMQTQSTLTAENDALKTELDQLNEEFQLFLESYDTLSDGYVELFRDYNYLVDDYSELEGVVETEAVNRSKIILPEAFSSEMVFDDAVVVSNTLELINAIEDHTHIVLNDGIYDLSSMQASDIDNPNITLSASESGYVLNIDFISDLLIEGTIYGTSTIKADGINGLMAFNSCNNIMIKNVNLEFGNDSEFSDVGNNIRFNDCEAVYIDKTNIQGHGNIGISIETSENIYINDSIIADCIENGVEFNDSKELIITHSIIRNCDDGALLDIGSSGLYIYESELDGEYISSY